MEVSKNGYRRGHSPTDYKVVPSNEISMLENDGSPLEAGTLLGIGTTTGNKKIMKPGETYTFKGDDSVIETPLAMVDIGSQMMQGYTEALSDAEVAAGATQKINGVACDGVGRPVQVNPNALKHKGRVRGKRHPAHHLQCADFKCRRKRKPRRRRRKGWLKDSLKDVTDFIGITDYDKDGNLITRAIDRRRKNKAKRDKDRERIERSRRKRRNTIVDTRDKNKGEPEYIALEDYHLKDTKYQDFIMNPEIS
tara:strand:+ start:1542 stop:2294 length:753 start_codon:yes stop_codon:yes gene_type:complete